jgi:hypothetical protein
MPNMGSDTMYSTPIPEYLEVHFCYYVLLFSAYFSADNVIALY